jgi:hypothetical protein
VGFVFHGLFFGTETRKGASMAPGRTSATFVSYLTTLMTATVLVFIWVGLSAIR